MRAKPEPMWRWQSSRLFRQLAHLAYQIRGLPTVAPLDAALRKAVAERNAINVEVLLRRGANPNTCANFGQSLLHLAVAQHDVGIAELLLKAGATVDARTTTQLFTPMVAAVARSTSEMVALLLEHGADPNVRTAGGSTPLIYAVLFQKPEAVRLLLAGGADPALRNGAGRTAAVIAREKGYDELVALFDEPGVDPPKATQSHP